MANAKEMFYICKSHLEEKASHFAKVALGSACEQWINAEMTVALNWANPRVLGKQDYARPEDKKRDIVIYDGSNEVETHVIEVKVLYPWTNETLKRKKTASLREQISPSNGDVRPRHMGVVFAIWTTKYGNEKPSEFFVRITDLLKNEFPAKEYSTQHRFILERIVNNEYVELAGEKKVIHIGATYVTRRIDSE